MKTYPKIQSVWMRDPENRHKTFIENAWSMPEFGYLADLPWIATEKVDGTNIRVGWRCSDSSVHFGGRTDDAQIPTFLYEKLRDLFPPEAMAAKFPECADVTLYGEGYGAKIQKDGREYIPDGCGFILFDVLIGGWWLTRESVIDVAVDLHVPYVPAYMQQTLRQWIEIVRAGDLPSTLRSGNAEGVVLRPHHDLFTRKGERIITKIKLKDFPK